MAPQLRGLNPAWPPASVTVAAKETQEFDVIQIRFGLFVVRDFNRLVSTLSQRLCGVGRVKVATISFSFVRRRLLRLRIGSPF